MVWVKVLCERERVTKLCEERCVTKWCVTKLCVKNGVVKDGVWKMVW